eukprot:155404_1
MANAGHIVLGVFTLLVWLFGYLPYILFHLIRFYNFRRDMTLSKRHPDITLYSVCFIVLWILVLILEIVRFFFGAPKIIEEIFDFLNIVVYFLFSCSILWRFWLLYYGIQFSVSASSREWQKFIDTEAQNDNWYFKKKRTYGDYTWTRKRFFIATAILIIVFVLISIPNFLSLLRFAFVVCPWVLIFLIYCKTPAFYDEFSIREEMWRVAALYIILFIGYIVFIIIIFAVEQADNQTTTFIAILVGVAFHFLAFVLFLIARTMTMWVLKTVDVGFDQNGMALRAPLNPWGMKVPRVHLPKTSQSGFENLEEPGNRLAVNSMSPPAFGAEPSTGQLSVTSTNAVASKFAPKEKKIRISLSTMFTDIKYLTEFCGHLGKEFSMECLLAMIEFIQVQQYVLMHMQTYKNYYYKQFPNLKIKNNVSLPKGIPRSTIVYGNNDDLVEKYLFNDGGRIISIMEREQVRVRLICYQLYKKYAAIGSEWEINISYETRGRLTARLHNFNEWMSVKQKNVQMWELAELFEDSKHEMYRLLRHSFARFKRRDDFEKITNYYQKQMEVKLAQQKKEQKTKKLDPEAYHQLPEAPKHEQKASVLDEEVMVDSADIIADLRKDADLD